MSSPRPSPTKPLASRDPNTSSPTKAKDSKPSISEFSKPTDTNKPRSMEYHRQVLQSKLEDEKSNEKYISPSDTIMSPCTTKLNAYKSKHFSKAKPQSLFAKMGASKKMDEGIKAEGDKEGKDGAPAP